MHTSKVQRNGLPSILASHQLPKNLQDRLLITPVEAGAYVGWAKQTVYNKLNDDVFPIPLVEFNGRKMVRVADLVRYVDGLESDASTPIKQPRRPGRPTKAEKIRREAEKKGGGSMSPQVNCIDQNEVEQVRSWLNTQDEDIQMAAVLEVARLRIMEAADLLFSLRFTHAESTRNTVLAILRAPSLSFALAAYEIDSDRFANAVAFEVRRIGTTRPDGFWRACGVGRPKGKKK